MGDTARTVPTTLELPSLAVTLKRLRIPALVAAVALGRMAESGVGAVMHCHLFRPPERLIGEAAAVARAARDIGIRVAFAVPLRDRRPDIPLLVVEGRQGAEALAGVGLDLSGLTNLYRMASTPDPRDFYGVSRAVLVPSLCYEVFPLAPVEAMANAVPVIARRIGALTEVVEESGGGMLFTTPQECREAMEKLLANPDLGTEIGRRGRQAVLAQWTEEVHMARYLALVEEVREQRADRS